MNPAGYNAFTGSLPSEMGLQTELLGLNLGKWKYLVVHLNCLRVCCVVSHNFSLFESHYI